MLLHESEGNNHTSHEPHRERGPEAVYYGRMVSWSAVLVATFVGVELIVNNFFLIGLMLTVLAAVGVVVLRSHSLNRLLFSNRKQGPKL